jgi:phospholipid/cholesterol/gamma-HCH transport system permease protein
MRVTEQIDALEVMGVNSLNYLVFPKIIALLMYYIYRHVMFWGFGVGGSMPDLLRSAEQISGIHSYCFTHSKKLYFFMLLATIPLPWLLQNSFCGGYGSCFGTSFLFNSITQVLME